MDLELLEECSLDVSLHFVGLREFTVHVNLLKVLYNTDFFSVVYLFIVLEEFRDNFFVGSWL